MYKHIILSMPRQCRVPSYERCSGAEGACHVNRSGILQNVACLWYALMHASYATCQKGVASGQYTVRTASLWHVTGLTIQLSPVSSVLSQDMGLLSLPEEILQHIASYFTLLEWAKGPALACRQFSNMKLPRVDLKIDSHVSPHLHCKVSTFFVFT